MNEYKKEREIIDGAEQSKKDEKKVLGKIDWNDGAEVSIVYAEKYREERKKILDRVVPSRICPTCRNKCWADSSWVIKRGLAICRSCFHSKRAIDESEIVGSFIGDPTIRFKINGWKIKSLRLKSGVGTYSFANKMGWSCVYQLDIEKGKVNTLSLEVVEKIISVFEEIGIIIKDRL